MFNNLKEYEVYVELSISLWYPLDVLKVIHSHVEDEGNSLFDSLVNRLVQEYVSGNFEYDKINNLSLLYYGYKIFEEDNLDSFDNERLALFIFALLPRHLFKFDIDSMVKRTEEVQGVEFVSLEISSDFKDKLWEMKKEKSIALLNEIKKVFLED